MQSTASESELPPEQEPRRKRRRLSLPDPSKIDRLPPHSIEAEQAALGCMLLSPNDCIAEWVDNCGPNPEVFYDLRHQEIFKVLVEMVEKKIMVSVPSVYQKLKDKNQAENCGGLAYLGTLPDAVPSAASLKFFADTCKEKYVLRRMIQTCTEVVSRSFEHEGEIDTIVDQFERDALSISGIRSEKTERTLKQIVSSAMLQIQDIAESGGGLTGIATGFPQFDNLTSGLQKGEMIVVAARPSMGKTSLAMNMAEHAAIESKMPVGVFSLEMTSESLIKRMLCSHARVNIRLMRDGFINDEEIQKLQASARTVGDAPLYIDDTPGLSIMQLRAKARRMFQEYGIKLFVIDYLQLLSSNTPRGKENRQQEVADISSGIKALAKELMVPVIVLSQLNREFEKDPTRKPRLSDLRESGAIEQDADLIGLLYKPGNTNAEENDISDCIPVNLLIAKQRNGPTGDVYLMFQKSFTRFESKAAEPKISKSDYPQDDRPKDFFDKQTKPYPD